MSQLKAQYLQRFNELIADGERLGKTKFKTGGAYMRGDTVASTPVCHWVDCSQYHEWVTKVVTLIGNILPPNAHHQPTLIKLKDTNNLLVHYVPAMSFLKAMKNDYEHGFLDSLECRIEANLTCDYVELAEGLMKEAGAGTHSHIPAAVLAGAVLEKSLRSLCERQTQQIETRKANGDNKTMTPLIEELQKAGVLTKPQGRQLQVYADIRNHAAHGEFDKFSKSEVEGMIVGVNKFLADFMG